MLFWGAIGVFGFSIGMIWYSSWKKKIDRENQLKNIQNKIKENERIKSIKNFDKE